MQDSDQTKNCTKCKEIKALDQFRKKASSKDGLRYWCKPCDNAASKRRYLADPEKAVANAKRWSLANPDKRLTINARSNAKQRTGITPEKCAMTDALYVMARILSNTCEPMEIDHIVPLSEGGTHTFENLQILTAKDNRKKGNKI
jgi:5-methylcytosine-specific restriction endonuclease McrA